MKPLEIRVTCFELYSLQMYLLGNEYSILFHRTTLYSIFFSAKIFVDSMPNTFVLWNSFMPKGELSSAFQVPLSQLSCPFWICSKALFAAGALDDAF